MKRQTGSNNTIQAVETFRVLKENSNYKKAIELTSTIHSLNESQVRVLSEVSKSSVQKKIDKCNEHIVNLTKQIKESTLTHNEPGYKNLVRKKKEMEEVLVDLKKELKGLKESFSYDDREEEGEDFFTDKTADPANQLPPPPKTLQIESEEMPAEETTEIDPSQPNSYYFSSKEDIMCVNGLDHPRAQGLAVEIMAKFRSMFEEAFIKAEVEGNYVLTLEFKQPEVSNDNPLEQESEEDTTSEE